MAVDFDVSLGLGKSLEDEGGHDEVLLRCFSSLLTNEIEYKRKELVSIEQNILNTKLELFRLRAVLTRSTDATHNEEIAAKSNNSLINVGRRTPPPSLINKSWVEFERQFIKERVDNSSNNDDNDSDDGRGMYSDDHSIMDGVDYDDWCIDDAVNILSTAPVLPAHNGSSSVCDSSSRFYSRHTIVVGNTTQYIRRGVRESYGNPSDTHKWMVYVRSYDNRQPLERYIKSVSFFLHPSYAPNDIVCLLQPPFQLTRSGWGEFPIRVQLSFIDPSHKPIDIIHNLRLDNTRTGQQMLGNETIVNIDLFRDCNEGSGDVVSGIEEHETIDSCSSHDDTVSTIKPESSIISSNIWQIVYRIAKQVPLYGNRELSAATSIDEFNNYNIIKQRALEWIRAAEIKRLLQNMKIPELDQLTTKRIVVWCRNNGHTPHPSQHHFVSYCKHCGSSVCGSGRCHYTTSSLPNGCSDVASVLSSTSNVPSDIVSSVSGIPDDSEPQQSLLKYRVPRSPELNWVHQSCLSIDIHLYPQSHNGMLLHVVDHMIFSACSQFLYQLLKYVVTMETGSLSWRNERIIVPSMIQIAIKEIHIFDFLTNNLLINY